MIKGEGTGGTSEFRRYRGSSKAFLILCMPVVILFLVGHIIKMTMTDGGTVRMANISDKLALFLQVVEKELSFTYLMYFIAIELCSFHEFTTVCSACLIALTFLLCFAYALPDSLHTRNGIINNVKKRKIMLALKTANVCLTVFAFLVIFASDMHLDIATDI
jgi:hypothetical protein